MRFLFNQMPADGRLVLQMLAQLVRNVPRTTLIVGYLTILLPGCARLQIAGTDAHRLTVSVVAPIDAEPLIAAAPDGQELAVASNGTRVISIASGKSRLLSAERPSALAWSPDGERLAAAFKNATGSRITVFGTDGSPQSEIVVAGQVAAIFWPTAAALMAVTLELEHHTFGTSCRELLLRWQMAGTPARTLLHEATLKPGTVRTRETRFLTRLISPAISPLGDELAYARIHDAPAFDAYLKIMVRNIAGGVEREVGRTAFSEGAVRFSANGEELLIHDGSGHIRTVNAWSGSENQAETVSGRDATMSPDGHYMLVDGRLLEDAVEIARFPSGTSGTFMNDGRLLVADNGTLFMLSGLAPPLSRSFLPPEARECLRTLRTWRASGLISPDDYDAARGKVIK